MIWHLFPRHLTVSFVNILMMDIVTMAAMAMLHIARSVLIVQIATPAYWIPDLTRFLIAGTANVL